MNKIKNITYCCIDCGDEIVYQTALYGKGRCHSCKSMGLNHPMVGKHHSKETKIKISASNKGKELKQESSSYINGVYCNDYFCIDCGKLLSSGKPIRCNSCNIKNCFKIGKLNTKGSNNAMFGKKGKLHPNYLHGLGNAPYPLIFDDKLKLEIILLVKITNVD
ncbi:MAG: NUMOD3 domain-containing DNA-binding protein [Nanoarchaeota archaeon]